MVQQVKVLVAGTTGLLGEAIVNNILSYSNVKVRALVTTLQPTDEKKQKKVAQLKEKSAELVVGSLFDKQSLVKATEGVDVVVSAVSGGEDVLTTGQNNLIDASVENKVKVFIPSYYGTYDESITLEDSPYINKKKQVNEYAATKNLKAFIISTGMFYEFVDYFYGIDGKFQHYGDENVQIQSTSVDDIGKFVAAVVYEPSRWDSLPVRINVTGDPSLTTKKLYQTRQEFGETRPFVKAGGPEDARKIYLEKLQKDPSNFYDWFMYSLRALGPSERILPPNPPDFSNKLFPEVKPTSYRDFLKQKQ